MDYFSVGFLYPLIHIMMMKIVVALCLLMVFVTSCTDKNCVFCAKAKDKCEHCREGYRLTPSFRCEACSNGNCLDCPDYFGKCKICKDGYRVAAGTCFKCIDDNCKKCPKVHVDCE